MPPRLSSMRREVGMPTNGVGWYCWDSFTMSKARMLKKATSRSCGLVPVMMMQGKARSFSARLSAQVFLSHSGVCIPPVAWADGEGAVALPVRRGLTFS